MLKSPANFTNPFESKIVALEYEYRKGVAAGKFFEELKPLKERIKTLKDELIIVRMSIHKSRDYKLRHDFP